MSGAVITGACVTSEIGLRGTAHDRNRNTREKVYVHALFVRVFHWVNALGMTLMIMSGWRIYNASPLFDFRFPSGSPWAAGWAAPCNGISPPCGCW